jgi:hypothetical protein
MKFKSLLTLVAVVALGFNVAAFADEEDKP